MEIEELKLNQSVINKWEEYGKNEGKQAAKMVIDEIIETKTDDELYDIAIEILDNEYQTSDYINNLLPEVRRDAGYEDSGLGTYRIIPNIVGYDKEDISFYLDENTRELLTAYEDGFVEVFVEEAKKAKKNFKGGIDHGH